MGRVSPVSAPWGALVGGARRALGLGGRPRRLPCRALPAVTQLRMNGALRACAVPAGVINKGRGRAAIT